MEKITDRPIEKKRAGSKEKLSPEAFIELWNRHETITAFAVASGYTVLSASRKKNELKREYGWTFKALRNDKGNVPIERDRTGTRKNAEQKKNGVTRRAVPQAPLVPALPADLMAAYAAATLDGAGNVISRAVVSQNGTTRQHLKVKISITTCQRKIVEKLQQAYGGEIVQQGLDNGSVVSYLLSWSKEEELHTFLSSVLPYSVRWADDLKAIVAWLEAYVILKFHEEDILKSIVGEG